MQESRGARRALVALLAVYAGARVLQVFPTRVPTLSIVVLHVVPPAVFAWIHGARAWGRRGMVVFTAVCLGVASFFEILGLRTGFPYGHYFFTGVMGPKISGLPILLALAYLGMGYAAWMVAEALLGPAARSRAGVLLLPLAASGTMTAWDVAMDPVWVNVDRAWVWRDGGAWFGVPLTNYFGWLLTTWVFYQAFALWLRRREPRVTPPGWQRLAVLLYGMSAAGNLLLAVPSAVPATYPAWITDAAGHTWRMSVMVAACLVVSVGVMGSLALAAWVRAGDAAGPERQEAPSRSPREPMSA